MLVVTFLFYLIAAFLPAYPMRHFTMPSGSMIPSIQENDHVLVDTGAYVEGKLPKRGDIIVFRQGDYYMVKRVVGVPGDRIGFSLQGFLLLNNGRVPVRQVEPNLDPVSGDHATGSSVFEETPGNKAYRIVLMNSVPRYEIPPTHVGENMVYVAGDQRDNSKDSRHFGLVSKDNVIGRVKYVFAYSWARGFTELPP